MHFKKEGWLCRGPLFCFCTVMDFKFLCPPYRRSYSLDTSDTGPILLFGGCADDKQLVWISMLLHFSFLFFKKKNLFLYQIYDDLWKFDLGSGLWTYVLQEHDWPGPRYAHASVFVPSSAPGVFAGSLLIFGGRTHRGVLLSDFWVWNEAKQHWREV